MKKDLVVKPNQLIEISGNISGVQSKMYNVILARAHQELKKNPNQTSFEIKLDDVKKASGVNTKDDARLKRNLKKLLDISIEYTDEKENWGGFNLISAYLKENEKNKLKIELPGPIREALISNNYYTTLDLLMIKSLESKYSIALYEMALKYHKVQIPEYSIETFRKLTGTLKSSSYGDFQKLRTRVINTAITEINEKTDIILDYTTKKTGRKVTSIKFEVKKKPLPILEAMHQEADVIEEQVENKSLEAMIMKAKKNLYVSKAWNGRVDNKIKKLLQEKGEEYTVNLLKELYSNLRQEIKTTLVQYINGMQKQMKIDSIADKIDQKKKAEKKQATFKSKQDFLTSNPKLASESNELQKQDCDTHKDVGVLDESERIKMALKNYENLNSEKKTEVEDLAKELYLKEMDAKNMTLVHKKIFKSLKGKYISKAFAEKKFITLPMDVPAIIEEDNKLFITLMDDLMNKVSLKSDLDISLRLELIDRIKNANKIDDLIAINKNLT